MNESYPASFPPDSIPPVAYKDRSTGLMVFGILTILLGIFSGLLALLILAGQAMATSAGQPAQPFTAILPAMLVYVLAGVALIWLGIGSLQAQRWARGLLLIFSWSALLIGIIAMVEVAVVLPAIMANLPDQTANTDHPVPTKAVIQMIMFFSMAIVGFVFILLPAVWVFFYASKHVKATCEARHPQPCWIDACPLPVLATALWLAFSGAMLLLAPISNKGVLPFFGMFLSGIPGMISYLIMAAVWLYAAWLIYRVDVRGWWLALIALCAFMISSIVTYSFHDITEMYQLMGYPEAQIEQIQKIGMFSGNRMIWFSAISMLPMLGYLFFIKRYFKRTA